MTGALIRPTSTHWFRGPARQDGEWVVFDGRRAEWYDPSDDLRIGLELARVRSPKEAVAFVQRYGLLVSFQNDIATDQSAGSDQMGTKPLNIALTKDFERREPIDAILEDARRLQGIFSTVRLARRAADGDSDAVARLERDMARDLADHPGFRSFGWRPAEAVELWMTRMAGVDLATQIKTARPYVRATAAGKLELRLIADTLLTYCYLSAAYVVANERVEICPECARAFVVDDARQKFCEPRCSGRARFRNFVDNRRKEGRHGKATRTR